MGDKVIFYTIHCPMCKSIQKTMDKKNISYQMIDTRDEVLKKAEELNLDNAPFAIINNKCYNNTNLKNWVEEYDA